MGECTPEYELPRRKTAPSIRRLEAHNCFRQGSWNFGSLLPTQGKWLHVDGFIRQHKQPPTTVSRRAHSVHAYWMWTDGEAGKYGCTLRHMRHEARGVPTLPYCVARPPAIKSPKVRLQGSTNNLPVQLQWWWNSSVSMMYILEMAFAHVTGVTKAKHSWVFYWVYRNRGTSQSVWPFVVSTL